MDDDEHEGVDPSASGQYLGAGEITGKQAGHMRIDERLPIVGGSPPGAGAFAGVYAFSFEDVLDAGGADFDTELSGLAQQTPVAPGDVFLGHAENQLCDALDRALATHPARFLAGGGFPAPTAVGSQRSDQETVVNLVIKLSAGGQQLGAFIGLELEMFGFEFEAIQQDFDLRLINDVLGSAAPAELGDQGLCHGAKAVEQAGKHQNSFLEMELKEVVEVVAEAG